MIKHIWMIYNKEFNLFWCDQNGWNEIYKRPVVFASKKDAEDLIQNISFWRNDSNIVVARFDGAEEPK